MRYSILLVVAFFLVGCGSPAYDECNLESQSQHVGLAQSRCYDSILQVPSGGSLNFYAWPGRINLQGQPSAVGKCATLADGTYELDLDGAAGSRTCSFTISTPSSGQRSVSAETITP